jgi:hypothetical protein
LLQDDIAKFVSGPTPPPQHVDIPEEGKGKPKNAVKSVKVTTLSLLNIHPARRMGNTPRAILVEVQVQLTWAAQYSPH